jgi:hypothetical protein
MLATLFFSSAVYGDQRPNGRCATDPLIPILKLGSCRSVRSGLRPGKKPCTLALALSENIVNNVKIGKEETSNTR